MPNTSFRSEVPLIMLLFSMLVLLVLPVPPLLLDFLIGMNICTTTVLMVAAVHLQSPLQFSSFPSVLLILTLFRLSLSVATTRQILLTGDAGNVIITFGQFVAGGNLAVGLIVFLILTIIQFLVITKGAERVAEVGARFSLDGMPGKQMSIDGDLRAGLIDGHAAGARRVTLEQESKFYGAMDGAMKFVKGDAIAGLIIVFINLIGGIAVGVSQKDMSMAEALATYAILTIGDGLVGQIPALLIAIAAGIIVTRVGDGKEKSNVGRDFTTQLLAEPRALIVGGSGIIFFGFMPGMPSTIFTAIGLALLTMVFFSRKKKALASKRGALASTEGGGDSARTSAYEFSIPILACFDTGVLAHFSEEVIEATLKDAQQSIGRELGIRVPAIQFSTANASPESVNYTLSMHEVPVLQAQLRPDALLVLDARHPALETLDVPLTMVDEQRFGQITAWAPAVAADVLRSAGIAFVQGLSVLSLHLEWVIVRHSQQLLGIQETHALLESLGATYPDLVKELRRVMQEQKVADVLQRLVAEKVSIRNLRLIAETLVQMGSREKDVVVLTEYARAALCHQISHQITQGGQILMAYLLSPEIENEIRNAIRQTSGGNYLQMDAQISEQIVAMIQQTLSVGNQAQQASVILTPMEIRRYVRKLIENTLPLVTVVAYQELTVDIQVQPIARIGK